MHEPTSPPPEDRYARGSFSMRRMESWQIWTMVAVIVLLALALIFWW